MQQARGECGSWSLQRQLRCCRYGSRMAWQSCKEHGPAAAVPPVPYSLHSCKLDIAQQGCAQGTLQIAKDNVQVSLKNIQIVNNTHLQDGQAWDPMVIAEHVKATMLQSNSNKACHPGQQSTVLRLKARQDLAAALPDGWLQVRRWWPLMSGECLATRTTRLLTWV